VSQLKICDFLGETFKGFEGLSFSWSATTTQLFFSGEFCSLLYDTIPVHLQTFLSTPITQKMPNFELRHLSQMSEVWRPALQPRTLPINLQALARMILSRCLWRAFEVHHMHIQRVWDFMAFFKRCGVYELVYGRVVC
jgi:hypothetical protein